MLQRVDLADRRVAPAVTLTVTGFLGDTLVRDALVALASATEPCCARIRSGYRSRPVRRQLGRGDGARARQRHARDTAARRPRPRARRDAWSRCLSSSATGPSQAGRRLDARAARVAAGLLGRARTPDGRDEAVDGGRLRGLDDRDGAAGWEDRRARLDQALAAVRRPRDLAALPPNDLVSSPLVRELSRLGAFRADVSGAGPVVYGLHHRPPADVARARSGAQAPPG